MELTQKEMERELRELRDDVIDIRSQIYGLEREIKTCQRTEGKETCEGMTEKENKIIGSVDFSRRSCINVQLPKPLLHIGDEIRFRDANGKAYILRVMREAEE